jgi:hypothetical protein
LEKRGLDVVRLKLRHAKMLGGGFHCITLDIRRTGTLQRYFEQSPRLGLTPRGDKLCGEVRLSRVVTS